MSKTGCLLASDPDTVRVPDLAFGYGERVAEVGETGRYLAGAPDLAVEVIPPGAIYTGVEGKVTEWLRAGVPGVDPLSARSKSTGFLAASRRYQEMTRSTLRT